MIAVVDYGLGNLGSICNMLKKIGTDYVRTSNIEEIKKADKFILSGVGAFDTGMKNIHSLNLYSILNEKIIKEECPVLGICLGMQLLTNSSDEGTISGLGWIDAKTIRFNFKNITDNLKIPHMGWNEVSIDNLNPLVENLGEKPRFYFVHSYHVVPNNYENIMLTTEYGFKFVSGICKGNIYGIQFHPEKSHKYGMKLLKNFAEI